MLTLIVCMRFVRLIFVAAIDYENFQIYGRLPFSNDHPTNVLYMPSSLVSRLPDLLSCNVEKIREPGDEATCT